MIPKLAILGSGGFAKEAAWVATQAGYMPYYVVPNDRVDEVGRNMVIGIDSDIQNLIQSGYFLLVGVGTPNIREKLFEKHDNARWPHLNIGTSGPNTSYGRGNIICAGNIHTCDIRVGDNNIFNLSCTVGHDAIIGSHNVINPSCNISGGVTIGNGCLIGTGAKILENLTIGCGAVVGAGAVVTKDVPPGATVVGVPAKQINAK